MSVSSNTVGNKGKRNTSSHTAQVSIDISSFSAKQQAQVHWGLTNENYSSNHHNCMWKKSFEEEHSKRTEAENLYIKCLKVSLLLPSISNCIVCVENGVRKRAQRDAWEGSSADEGKNKLTWAEELSAGDGDED